ncbi:hypothetical protein JW905_06310 [bacterium]|nr:hypothetical protein [candidate division CSSED10-310 bacterium]
MRVVRWLSVLFCCVVLMSACGDKEEITIQAVEYDTESPVISIVREYAELLEEPVSDPMKLPRIVMAIDQGDQIHVLEKYDDWSKIMHQKTGRMGWLHNSFIQTQERSQWWSGDTEQARTMSRAIFKDKTWLKQEWYVRHINIEERFQRMKIIMDPTHEVPVNEAENCARHWITVLEEAFPRWSDHQIFLEATHGDTEFTLVMGENRKATILNATTL